MKERRECFLAHPLTWNDGKWVGRFWAGREASGWKYGGRCLERGILGNIYGMDCRWFLRSLSSVSMGFREVAENNPTFWFCFCFCILEARLRPVSTRVQPHDQA